MTEPRENSLNEHASPHRLPQRWSRCDSLRHRLAMSWQRAGLDAQHDLDAAQRMPWLVHYALGVVTALAVFGLGDFGWARLWDAEVGDVLAFSAFLVVGAWVFSVLSWLLMLALPTPYAWLAARMGLQRSHEAVGVSRPDGL